LRLNRADIDIVETAESLTLIVSGSELAFEESVTVDEDEEAEALPADRRYWEDRVSKATRMTTSIARV